MWIFIFYKGETKMKKIVMESYGKINLGLDVLYKRQDGYHEINTIMQQISLKDTLVIEENKDNIILQSNKKDLPLDSRNLMHKAWVKLREKTNIKRGVKIRIDKQIPIAAGLAGGSSNAAIVLRALNSLWELGLSEEELRNIGVEIGADVPYCIMGGTAYAEGIGEKLTKLKPFSGKSILLVNPGIEVSTEYVYKNLKIKKSPILDMEKIILDIEKDDMKSLGRDIKNIMEEVVTKEYPIIKEIKKEMKRCGALGALMSGSGPTVFGLFDDKDKLKYCKERFTGKLNKGIILEAETI